VRANFATPSAAEGASCRKKYLRPSAARVATRRDKIAIDSPGIIGLIWAVLLRPSLSLFSFSSPFLPSVAIIGTVARRGENRIIATASASLEAIHSRVAIMFILYLVRLFPPLIVLLSR